MSDEGVPVSGLFPNCHAERAGVKVGDLIVSVNEQPVKNIDDFILAAALKKHTRTMVVVRDGIMLDIEMAIGLPSPKGNAS